MTVKFIVHGKPYAKQRPRVTFKSGRAATYTPKPTKDYEREIWWCAKQACPSMLSGPLRVDLHFIGSHGDVDNLAKAALDGMQGAVFSDDRQVIEMHVYVQRRGEPRTEVEVQQVAS